jgi:hypothetical protein
MMKSIVSSIDGDADDSHFIHAHAHAAVNCLKLVFSFSAKSNNYNLEKDLKPEPDDLRFSDSNFMD